MATYFDRSTSPVFINQIATAVPPHEVHQGFVDYIPRLLSEERERQLFTRLAKKAQITSRYSFLQVAGTGASLDVDDFYSPKSFPSTTQRMQKYQQHALQLASLAIAELLKTHASDSITHLVVTSCTGFYAPGLDLEIVKTFALNPQVERTLIGFMGCYAAINGLKSAYHIVRSQPKAKVLLVNLELCTLHLQEKTDFESLLSFLQFGDGCAASLISAEPKGLELTGFRCELIPEESELIQWHVRDSGFEMKLSLQTPRALGSKLQELAASIKQDTKIWAVHPGGRSILDSVETSLGLNSEDLLHSRRILNDYGNMSSATVMFVLQKVMQDRKLHGPGTGMAFGPGLSLEMFQFHKQEQLNGTQL